MKRLLLFIGLALACLIAPAQAATKPFDCGPGGYLLGFTAQSGVWVDRIGAICGVWDQATQQIVSVNNIPPYGTSVGGSPNPPARCPTGSAIASIGDWEPLNGGAFVIENVHIVCRSLRAPHQEIGPRPIIVTAGTGKSDNEPSSEFHTGPPDGTEQPCGGSLLATGFSVDLDQDKLAGLTLKCGIPPEQWAPHSGPIAPPSSAPAPLPTQPIDISGGGSYPLGPQGGGHQTDVVCSTGMAMVGIYSVGKAGNVDRLDVRCANFAGRTWSGASKAAGSLGQTSVPIGVLRTCTPPNAITAIDGDVSSYGGIARLRLHCGTELSAYVGRSAANNLEYWTHGTITCGPGNVATGIYGWVDPSGTLKSFGLHCLPASAFGSAASGGGTGGGPGGGSSGGGQASLGDFAGTWHVTVNTGYAYTMTLFVSGGVIRGSYDTGRANGQVNNGVLSGGSLNMDLSQSAVVVGSGKGTFKFSDPLTLSGTWSIGPYNGTWTATR